MGTRLLGTATVGAFRRGATLRGASFAMDLRGDSRRRYRSAVSGQAADLAAVASDWQTVGQDLFEAAEQHLSSGE